MSAFDVLSWLKTFGGQAESRAGSLTGDMSQRDKALIARTVQSTSPGLTRNKAGSVGEQLQYLIDTWDNTVAPADAANAAGSMAAMLKYVVANLTVVAPATVRNLYLINGFDVWGFDGWQAIGAGTNDVPPYASGLTSGGFARGGTTANITFGVANNVAGRGLTLQCAPAASGQVTRMSGIIPGSASVRYHGWPVGLPNSYTIQEMEAIASLQNVTAAHMDAFMGWWDLVGNDPYAATANAIGIGHQSNDPNWSIVVNKAGTVVKTSIAACAALTAYTLKIAFDGTTVTGTVNATTATTSGATLPTQASMAGLAHAVAMAVGRASSAAPDNIQFEWVRERFR